MEQLIFESNVTQASELPLMKVCENVQKMKKCTFFLVLHTHYMFCLFVFCLFFFLLEFIPCKTEQSIQGIELQEKEGQKD